MRLGAPRPAAGPGPRGGRHTCTIALAHQIKGQEHDFACAWAARLWALVAPTREVLDTDSLDFGYYDIMLGPQYIVVHEMNPRPIPFVFVCSCGPPYE